MSVSGLANSYLSWPNREPVTVEFERIDGAVVPVELEIAKKNQTTLKETTIAGIHFTGDQDTWHLPDALLEADGNYPGNVQRGDRIKDKKDPATTWVVGWAKLESHGTRWRCICTEARFDT